MLKSKDFKYLVIPCVIFLIFTFATFIFSSFFDIEIAKIFEKGMKYKIIKVFILFYDELGVIQMTPIIYLLFGIIFETLYFRSNKNRWALNFYYIFFLFVFFFGNLIVAIYGIFQDHGFGVGFDPKILENSWWRFWIRLILLVIGTIIFIVIFYYLRIFFSKRTDILIQEYWIDSIKALMCILINYLIIFFVKWSMGRPYYYNVNFESIYKNEILPLGISQHLPDHPNFKAWGIGEEGNKNAIYHNWWSPNNFVKNLKYWFNFSEQTKITNDVWWNRAFPSGHIISSFSLLYVMFLFLGENKNRYLNKYKIIYLLIIFIHINLMQYLLIIYRFHWLTDTTFSIINGILMILVVDRLTNMIIYKIIGVKKFKKFNNKNKILMIKNKSCYEIFWISYEWKIYFKKILLKNEKKFIKKYESFFIIKKNII